MARIILSAEEIRGIVQELVNTIPEIVADGAYILVPLPQWHKADKYGCNWNMEYFRNTRGHEHAILAQLERVREAYNLPE
jgi:hypothetical protein